MKTVTVERLELRNFKGIKHAVHELGGHSANVFGTNEIGKTTTFADALAWLLTGKDSAGRTEFDVKTRGLEKADHSVTATLNVDGKVIELSRNYRENWVKKRGSSVEEFSGHRTEYQFDGVPETEKTFTEKAALLLPLDEWALLTNPTHFAAMRWQDRREILVNLIGEVTDDDVIAANKALADLPGILGDRSIEDHQKTVVARRRAIVRELEGIQPRIDEVQRSLEALEDAPETAGLEQKLAALTKKRDELAEEIRTAAAGLSDVAVRRALGEAREELREIERGIERAARDTGSTAEVAAARKALNKAEGELTTASSALRGARLDFDTAEGVVQNAQRKLNSVPGASDLDGLRTIVVNLKREHAELLASEPALEAKRLGEDVEELTDAAEPYAADDERLRGAIDKVKFGGSADDLLAELNEQRANRLEELQTEIDVRTDEGKKLAAQVKEATAAAEAELESAKAALEVAQAALQEREEAHAVAATAVKDAEAALASAEETAAQSEAQAVANIDFETFDEWVIQNAKVEELQADLAAATGDEGSALEKLEGQQKELSAQVDETAAALSSAQATRDSIERQRRDGSARIEELSATQIDLNNELEQIDRELHLCDLWTRTHAGLISDRVNSMFAITSFDLFEEQINGGIKATCTITNKDGVTWEALSFGARIRTGLDIVTTLQRAAGVNLPIAVDNRESVAVLPELNTQIFNLIVSPKDTKLRVELIDAEGEEAA